MLNNLLTHIKSNKNIKHFLNYFSASVFLRLLSLLIIPFLLRVLNAEEYGKLILYQSYLGFATILVTLNTSSAVGRYCYEKQDDLYQFVGNTLIINVLCFFVVGSLVMVKIDFIATYFGIAKWFVIFLLSLGLLKSMISIYYQLLIPLKLSKEYSWITFLEGAGTLIFTLLFSWFLIDNKFYGGFYSILLISVLLLAYIFYKVRHEISLKISKKHLKYILYFSIPQIPNLLSGVIIEQISKVIIGLNGNYVNVGKFNILAQIASILLFVSGSLRSTFLPDFYVALQNNDQKSIRLGCRINFYITCGIAVLLVIFSQEILYIIAGDKYLEYHYALGWFTFPLVIYDLFLINSLIIEYEKKMIFISVIAILGGISTLLFSNLIFQQFGFKYVIFASSLAYFVMYICSALVLKYIFKSGVNILKHSYDIIIPFILIVLVANIGYFYFIDHYFYYTLFRLGLLVAIAFFYRKELFKLVSYFRATKLA